MRIYRIASTDITAWIVLDGSIVEAPLGHDVVVYQHPEMFGIDKGELPERFDYRASLKQKAIENGGIAFRVITKPLWNTVEMAVYGTKESIRKRFEVLHGIARQKNVSSFIVNIGGNYVDYGIEKGEFFSKYAGVGGG